MDFTLQKNKDKQQILENCNIEELSENVFNFIKNDYFVNIDNKKLRTDVLQILQQKDSQTDLEGRTKLIDQIRLIQNDRTFYCKENQKESENACFQEILKMTKTEQDQKQENSHLTNYQKVKNFSQRKSNIGCSQKKSSKKKVTQNKHIAQKFQTKKFDLRNITNKSKQGYFDTKVLKNQNQSSDNNLKQNQKKKQEQKNKKKDNLKSQSIQEKVSIFNEQEEQNMQQDNTSIIETDKNENSIQFEEKEIIQKSQKKQQIDQNILSDQDQIVIEDTQKQNQVDHVLDTKIQSEFTVENKKQSQNSQNEQENNEYKHIAPKNKNFEIIRKFSQKQLSPEHKITQQQNKKKNLKDQCSLRAFKSCDKNYFQNLRESVQYPQSIKNSSKKSKQKKDTDKCKDIRKSSKIKNVINENKRIRSSFRQSLNANTHKKNPNTDIIKINSKINQLKAKVEREAKEKMTKIQKEKEQEYLLYKKEEVQQKE